MSSYQVLCSYKSASGKISAEGDVCDNRSINYCDKSVNSNKTPDEQNQFIESNLVNNYIDVHTILKDINDSLTRNDEIPETVNEITNDTNFNDMLHNNVEYLMDDVIKEFIDECFIKDVIFGESSVYDHFYDDVRANNHDTIANACITKNANVVESTIRHDEITIHSNSNFNNITDASITVINEENENNSISKVTILNDLIKCKYFLEKVQKFNSNIEKTKHEPDKLDDETKHLKTDEDGNWKKGTTLIMGDSVLSELREHKMSHRRSLKVC